MATVFSSDFFHCLNLVQPDPEGLNGGKRKKNGKKINRTGRALSNRTMEAVLAPLNPTSAHYSLRASPKDARPAGAARFPHIHRRLIHFPKHKSNREWRGGEGKAPRVRSRERHPGAGRAAGAYLRGLRGAPRARLEGARLRRRRPAGREKEEEEEEGRDGSGRAAVPLSPAEPRTERAVPRRMRAVGAAVERLLAAAQRSARLSVGVYEAAKLLNA